MSASMIIVRSGAIPTIPTDRCASNADKTTFFAGMVLAISL